MFEDIMFASKETVEHVVDVHSAEVVAIHNASEVVHNLLHTTGERQGMTHPESEAKIGEILADYFDQILCFRDMTKEECRQRLAQIMTSRQYLATSNLKGQDGSHFDDAIESVRYQQADLSRDIAIGQIKELFKASFYGITIQNPDEEVDMVDVFMQDAEISFMVMLYDLMKRSPKSNCSCYRCFIYKVVIQPYKGKQAAEALSKRGANIKIISRDARPKVDENDVVNGANVEHANGEKCDVCGKPHDHR